MNNETIPLLVPALFCVLVKVSPSYCDFKVYICFCFFTVVSNNVHKKELGLDQGSYY